MQTELSKKKNKKQWYHIGLPKLKGGFSGLRHLSDSQIIPLELPIALYQTRRNRVIGEEQYQINNQTKPYIMTLQVLNSKKVDNNATFTTGLPSKTTFDSCMAK